MPIYDKPTKQLMYEFANDRLMPGKVFEKKEAVDWFAKHYPNIRSTTVQMHVEGMATNSGSRKHHPSIRPDSGHDLFFKVAPGRFRLWNKDIDTAPTYRGTSAIGSEPAEANAHADESDIESGGDEFAFERDLRNYLAKNLALIEQGLKVFEEEEFNGVEYPVGADLLISSLRIGRGALL